MDESLLLNQIAFDLEAMFRNRDPQFVAVRVKAPFFPSPIMGDKQNDLILRMAHRGLAFCRVPNSSDGLIYSGEHPQGKIIPVSYIIPFGISF